jgi:hypothetical protein
MRDRVGCGVCMNMGMGMAWHGAAGPAAYMRQAEIVE